MKKRSTFCVLTMALTMSAGTVWAQDEDMEDDFAEDEMGEDEGMGDDGMGDDGMADDATGDAAAAEAEPAEPAMAAAGVGPFTKAGYPQAFIDRPLTLPKGMIELSGAITHAAISISEGGLSISGDITFLGVSASYGVMDQLTVGASTALVLDPDVEWSESFDIGALYLVHDTAKLDVSAGLIVPLRFGEDQDVLPGVAIEAPTRFLATDKIFVFGGNELLPINFDPSAIDLNINVGGGFQITPELVATLETQIVSLAISGDGNETSSLGDFIPVEINALYAISNVLDAFAGVQFPSIEDAGDFYAFTAGANFRL